MCQNKWIENRDAVANWYVCFNFDAAVVIADNGFCLRIYLFFFSVFVVCGKDSSSSDWFFFIIQYTNPYAHTHTLFHSHTHRVNWHSQLKVHWSRRCGGAHTHTHTRCVFPHSVFPLICRMHILWLLHLRRHQPKPYAAASVQIGMEKKKTQWDMEIRKNYLHLHIVHSVPVQFSVNPLEWCRLEFSQEMPVDRPCQSLWWLCLVEFLALFPSFYPFRTRFFFFSGFLFIVIFYFHGIANTLRALGTRTRVFS